MMIFKKLLFFTVIMVGLCSFAQTKNNTWQLGVGTGVVKFAEEDAAYIGDQYMFQVPRLNLTIPISHSLAFDGALSFNTFDVGFITNSAKYFSMDGSLRYTFNFDEKFFPYVFAGGSIVDSERKMTPTMNIGAGANYWITDSFGVNSQLYYKHSLDSFESMRSHIQVTLGVVFALKIKGLSSGGSNRVSRSGCYYNPL
ncbi:outer membrane beta-barrel protein [Tenacibaculum sp. IB213877]|uniref:outer membrane beta-barrel protein n=1 Tax=Tenacibaculum sp. IB213877 TaxID=3097351 RepID=UPI002A599617|nr:outer membrane beta-barrel protein [Tenacibaculum sp. IB213877]MDY0780490.1 outer membrane beta-barrel protein [Tenacibaculum sp. IB213877]